MNQLNFSNQCGLRADLSCRFMCCCFSCASLNSFLLIMPPVLGPSAPTSASSLPIFFRIFSSFDLLHFAGVRILLTHFYVLSLPD